MLDFGRACRTGNPSLSSGQEGYRAFALVQAIYDSYRQESFLCVPA